MTDSKHRSPQCMGFDTLSLHAGQVPDPTTGARATPIYQSAAFVFPDSDAAAGLFNIERAGHVYSRLSNPTNAVLEERMAALDHGVGSVVTASGQAALHLAITTILSAGDHIVSSRSVDGGTHNLLEYTLSRFGISIRGGWRLRTGEGVPEFRRRGLPSCHLPTWQRFGRYLHV